MPVRFDALIIMFTVVMLGSGCVSTGTYQAKEQESLQLSKSLEESKATISEISDKNARLTTEAEALGGKVRKLDGEIATLKEETAKLKGENSKLKEESSRLKEENAKLAEAVKPDNLLKSLANSMAELQRENSKLKLSLEDAGKAAKQSAEPLRIMPDIAKPAPVEEKKVEDKPAPASKAEAQPEPAAEQKAPEAPAKP
jgi:chromosome segregation ATPase